MTATIEVLRLEFIVQVIPVLLSLLINRMKIAKMKKFFSICMNNEE
jgi:hypothetical protein